MVCAALLAREFNLVLQLLFQVRQPRQINRANVSIVFYAHIARLLSAGAKLRDAT